MADYLESLFEGIDIIVGKRLEAISTDTTIVCTITDASDAKNGQYLVNNGSITFLAYSEVSTYKNGDSVRVLVPQGNMSESKYIMGKAVTSTSTMPLTFVSSLNATVNVEETLEQNLYGIKINSKNKEVVVSHLVFGEEKPQTPVDNIIYLSNETLKSNLCNTITISADFKTLLNNYELRSGIYGLHLHIYEQTPDNAAVLTEHIAEFTSEEMFGNPYAFSLYSLQGKIFGTAALGTLDNVKEIIVCLFQDQKFYDAEKKLIGCKVNENEIKEYSDNYFISDNILVKNIKVGLGTNIVDVENRTLTLFTQDSPSFDYDKPDDNKRALEFIWFNKDDNNRYIGFSDNNISDLPELDSEGNPKPYTEYNELDYLALNRKNVMLQSKSRQQNIATDEDGLTLAFEISTVESNVKAAIEIYKKDFTQHLIKLAQASSSLVGEKISGFITQLNASLLTIEGEGLGSLKSLVTYYQKVLKYGYDIQVGNEDREWSDDWVDIENHKALNKVLVGIIEKYNNLLKVLEEEYFKFAQESLFSSYKKLLKIDIDNINRLTADTTNESINNALINVESNVAKLAAYKTKEDIIPWEPKDLSEYNNRYCIYWFKYVEGYVNPYDFDIIGNNWELVGEINTGLPAADKNGLTPAREPFKKSITLDTNKQQEKYKMVIYYNHVKYVSNEVVFTNIVDIASRTDASVTGEIIIEHLEKSKSIYFNYNIAKTLSIPIEAYYPRQLRARLVNSQTDEASLNGCLIYWHIPKKNTMLAELDDMEARGFKKEELSDNDYNCYYKEIKYSNGSFNDDKGFDTRDFWYCIKGYYNSTALLNTIKCEIKDNEGNILSSQVDFEFGTEGTNGTPYTLRVIPQSKQRAVANNYPLNLDLSVVDEMGKKVEEVEFSVKQICGSGSGSASIVDNTTLVARNWYGLVEIIAKLFGEIELSLVYSIPYTTNNDSFVYNLSGIIDIVYDSQGNLNSNYPNIPYEFYPSLPATAQIKYYLDGDVEPNLSAEAKKFYPTLKNNYLVAPNIYITNTEAYPKIILEGENGVTWYQFLNIIQNRFGSSVLNGWDGNFVIDEEHGTILSTMLGAGQKNSDNSFSGVLMGDILAGADTDVSGIGLYGYHEGAQSFGFNIDGTAFLGKSGQGRIYFDGNNGIIESGNHQRDNKTGMKIDLEDGYIDAYNFKLTSKGIILNANPEEENEAYVQIIYKDKNLAYIGKDANSDYYLQSANYEQGQSGTYFDLKEGLINAYNFKLSSKGIKMNSNPDDGDYYIMIGDPNTAEHISLDKNMHLDMQLSSLSIYSGENILRNTAPYEALGITTLENWVTIGGQLSSEEKDKKKCICCKSSDSDRYFYQLISVDKNSTYTISGYIYRDENVVDDDPRVGFSFYGDNEVTVEQLPLNSWTYFSKTVKVSDYSGETTRFIINPKGTKGNYFFANLKLEKGEIASAWSPSPKDNRQEIISQLELNTDDGIYLESGVLYVNASAIKTGVLTSKNYIEAVNGTVEAGTSFDLNNGILKSANLAITSTNFTLTSEGEISAKKGLIGGWTISENNLYGTDSNRATRVVLDAREDASHAISVGKYENFSNDKSTETGTYFGVTPSGELQARGGTFKGSIYAWGGTIGGISIYSDRLETSGWRLNAFGLYFKNIDSGIGYYNASGNAIRVFDFGTSSNANVSINAPLLYNPKVSGTLYASDGASAITGLISNASNTDAIKVNSYTIANNSIKVLGTSAASLGSYVQIGAKSELTFSTITSGSSRRFKNSITEDFDSSLLYRLKPVSYYYNKEMGYGGDKRYGFIAEAVDKIAPELVEHDYENPELCNALYYNSIITLAVAEIQKLRKELDILKGEKGND